MQKPQKMDKSRSAVLFFYDYFLRRKTAFIKLFKKLAPEISAFLQIA